MANSITTPVRWGYGPTRWTASRPVVPARIHALARFAFWTILLLSLTNAIGMIISWTRRLHDDRYELSIYPIIFAVCTVVVLTFSKSRLSSTLLVVAWVFWLVYFLGGFLGAMQITATEIRSTLRWTVKPWMTVVGLPWLAMRAISQDKVPRLIHATVIVSCLGAMVGLLQITTGGVMSRVTSDIGRAEGLWSNPATSGFICAMVLFLTFVCPFKWRVLNWTSRSMLLVGVGASLSRGPLVALIVSWIVYAVSTLRFGTLIKSALGLGLFVLITLAAIEATESLSKFHEQRLTSVRSLLSGKWEERTFSDRTELWAPALEAIVSEGGLLFGLGHGSMAGIVDTSSGALAPHNYYLFVLGNSGLLALVGLLAFHFALFQQSFKCQERQSRAALFAIATVLAMGHLVDDSLFSHPTTGAVLACIVVALAYARPQLMFRPRLEGPITNRSARLRGLGTISTP